MVTPMASLQWPDTLVPYLLLSPEAAMEVCSRSFDPLLIAPSELRVWNIATRF